MLNRNWQGYVYRKQYFLLNILNSNKEQYNPQFQKYDQFIIWTSFDKSSAKNLYGWCFEVEHKTKVTLYMYMYKLMNLYHFMASCALEVN